ncbi:hypothetical protein MFUM_800019 [Methylacidiphilum fumariolicum SolV]|uniref:Uncharacterized protein n=1 Tax=Methylacidiphilum fumariolicum (strain SolV) TaxID=1156937 RepID=I0JZY5_METFB|nr:hypothetical protein MFUM_800019 [Methylacidiphilum fumariolicum SolV]
MVRRASNDSVHLSHLNGMMFSSIWPVRFLTSSLAECIILGRISTPSFSLWRAYSTWNLDKVLVSVNG